jgi:hypothetical protein
VFDVKDKRAGKRGKISLSLIFPAFFQSAIMVNCMLILTHSVLDLQMTGQIKLLWQTS